MRLSTKHSLGKLAALATGVALLVASTAPDALAGLAIEVPHVIGVKVETPALHIETPSLPTVEVPGVLKVETTKTPAASSTSPSEPVAKVEVTTPVTTTEASIPPTTTGVSTTPVSQTPTRTSTTPGASPTNPNTNTSTTATAASVDASASGASATDATAGAAAANTTATDGRPARSRTTSKAGTRAERNRRPSRRATAADSTDASIAPASASGSSATLPRPHAAAREDASRQPAASDPLSSLGRQLPLPLPVPDWSKPIILLLLLLAIGFGVRSQLAARRARRLERQRGTLLRDLDAMQAALVPAIPERLGALSVSVAYRPADGPAAGGDFYDLIELEQGKVAIVLGDVVGHGRSALKRAALTRYTLRAYLQAGLEPRAALALASSVLAEPGEKQFATVVVGIHDSASGRLKYASAGHPAPIAVGFCTPEPLAICCSAPLCCDLPTGRRQTTISLPAGGRLCFFSDGLPEARVGEDLLGRERLAELAREPGAPLTAERLLGRVSEVAQTARDDMVACIVSPIGVAPPSAATVEELEVDDEALASPRVPRFLDACGIGSDAAASLLADATKLVGAERAALLRIVVPLDGEATATVLPGLSTPDWATAAVVPDEAAVAMLALPAER
jgi:hypothetical protein